MKFSVLRIVFTSVKIHFHVIVTYPPSSVKQQTLFIISSYCFCELVSQIISKLANRKAPNTPLKPANIPQQTNQQRSNLPNKFILQHGAISMAILVKCASWNTRQLIRFRFFFKPFSY